ncbi:MAG: hypothetical protein IKW04_00665 [Clostridia bacterium]|nr:hypothetical protein [Clostridia bacterium]
MNVNDQELFVQKIRAKYQVKETTGLDALKQLDKKVQRPANLFAVIFGSIAALIMGSGMSLVMTDIAEYIGISNPMVLGIVIGVLGMILLLLNHPIYKGILRARRKKYANEIFALSDQLMKG